MLLRTAKSCGPDAPTLASSPRSCVGPTGLRQNKSADDGGKRARSPGRARHKPLKPLRRECRVFRGTCGFYPCAFYIAQGASSVTGLEESIPFCVIHSPGTCFCPGSAQGRRLMGFMRGTGRPICGKRDHIVGCVDNPCDGLAWSIVPAKGLRFGESLV